MSLHYPLGNFEIGLRQSHADNGYCVAVGIVLNDGVWAGRIGGTERSNGIHEQCLVKLEHVCGIEAIEHIIPLIRRAECERIIAAAQ